MKKIKVLIVEDEALIAEWLRFELELFGYEVTCVVSSGEEAISEAGNGNPDIVLMDIYLSGNMDGLTASEEINRIKDIPIIFMTGYNEPNIIDRLKNIDHVAKLYKPIKATEVKAVIDTYFKLK